VKRYFLALVSVGTLLVAGWTLCRAERHEETRPTVRVEDVPMPIQFRQNQPSHWRYAVLSQGR
jgi:hypothetical protein